MDTSSTRAPFAVPFIIHWPKGMGPYPERSEDAVSLMTIAPTIVEAVGAVRPAKFQGRACRGQLTGKDRGISKRYTARIYTRGTISAQAAFPVSEKADYKYIHAPQPEFYDLRTRPRRKPIILWSRSSP